MTSIFSVLKLLSRRFSFELFYYVVKVFESIAVLFVDFQELAELVVAGWKVS